MNRLVRETLWLLVGIAAIGGAGLYVGGHITLSQDWQPAFWSRFQYMWVFAVLIERSVEVYLNASGLNGDDRFKIERNAKQIDGTKPATVASIVLGLLLAMSGLRLLSSVGHVSGDANWLTKITWYGVDVVVSGGLMAGGSSLFHDVAETIRGGINRIGEGFSTKGQVTAPVPRGQTRSLAPSETSAPTESAATTYTIVVKRTGKDTGSLHYASGGTIVDTKCWWDPQRAIFGGTYYNCSKTRMNTKTDSVTGEKRPAIFLPTAVAPDTGKNTIFIHEGKSPKWSDGCIVLNRDDMMTIWNSITPMNDHNITVVVQES